MDKIGHFLYRHRVWILPCLYLLLLLPSPPLRYNYMSMLVLGWLLAVLGQALRLLSIGTESPTRYGKDTKIFASKLITEGTYKIVRNPMYLGNLMILTGLIFIANSLQFFVFFLPLAIGVYAFIIFSEEKYLNEKFSEQYSHYKASTSRFVPKLSEVENALAHGSFNWKRILYYEDYSAFMWIMAALILTAFNTYSEDSSFSPFQQFFPFILMILVLATAYGAVQWLKYSGRLLLEDKI
ncbi:MAG: isoprenylcysteine carboxylmethyltransferase family protein [Sphingobacteriales bacterium]|nr:isoprenylcysteine carboxylmethyltransferase family protein [Sphingobacteriales bacterium]